LNEFSCWHELPAVSTGRQANNDLSIPDQRRQAKRYCTSWGWEIVADYVEPGTSATDDRRPEFQRMIETATAKPPAFHTIVLHSFVAASSAKTAGFGVPSFVPNWRTRHDSNV
jgi:hypothetical protein